MGDVHATFTTWCKDRGVTLAPSLELRRCGTESSNNCSNAIFAASDVRLGDVLCSIPKHACFTAATCTLAHLCARIGHRDAVRDLGASGLVFALAAERATSTYLQTNSARVARGASCTDAPRPGSGWTPYLGLLKHSEHVPYLWSDRELLALQGTQLVESAWADRGYMREDFRRCSATLLAVARAAGDEGAALHDALRAVTYEGYTFAASVVASRAFYIDAAHGHGLVPVADLFNHRCQAGGGAHIRLDGVEDEEEDEDEDEDGDGDEDERGDAEDSEGTDRDEGGDAEDSEGTDREESGVGSCMGSGPGGVGHVRTMPAGCGNERTTSTGAGRACTALRVHYGEGGNKNTCLGVGSRTDKSVGTTPGQNTGESERAPAKPHAPQSEHANEQHGSNEGGGRGQNHAISPVLRAGPCTRVGTETCVRENNLRVVCVQPARAGEELFNSFGDLTNEVLLSKYGFVETANGVAPVLAADVGAGAYERGSGREQQPQAVRAVWCTYIKRSYPTLEERSDEFDAISSVLFARADAAAASTSTATPSAGGGRIGVAAALTLAAQTKHAIEIATASRAIEIATASRNMAERPKKRKR